MKFRKSNTVSIDTPATDNQRLQIFQRLNINYFDKDLTYLQAKDIIDNIKDNFEEPKNRKVRYI